MKQLRKFLGIINFYRKFIPSCAQTLRPFNNLLSVTKSSKKQIQWSAEAESAFSGIKAKLSNATLLVYPTPNAETALFLDASSTSCGVVFGSLCHFFPIHFHQLSSVTPLLTASCLLYT